MSRKQKESLLNSVFHAFSTTGGYIVAALILIIVGVIASIFHVNWSERIAGVGLVILFTLIPGKREPVNRKTEQPTEKAKIAVIHGTPGQVAKIERQKAIGPMANPDHCSLSAASSISVLEDKQ